MRGSQGSKQAGRQERQAERQAYTPTSAASRQAGKLNWWASRKVKLIDKQGNDDYRLERMPGRKTNRKEWMDTGRKVKLVDKQVNDTGWKECLVERQTGRNGWTQEGK